MSEARVEGEYGRCAANGFTLKCCECDDGEGERLRLRRWRSTTWGGDTLSDVDAESQDAIVGIGSNCVVLVIMRGMSAQIKWKDYMRGLFGLSGDPN